VGLVVERAHEPRDRLARADPAEGDRGEAAPGEATPGVDVRGAEHVAQEREGARIAELAERLD
jgi:hypothetical protein